MNKNFFHILSLAIVFAACGPTKVSKPNLSKKETPINVSQKDPASAGEMSIGTEVGNGDIVTVEEPTRPVEENSDLDFFKKSVEEIKGYASERLSIVKTDKIEAKLNDYIDNSSARLSKAKFCVSVSNLMQKIKAYPENSPQQLDPEKRIRTNDLIDQMLQRCSKELELPLAVRNGLSKAYNELPVFSKLLLAEALTSAISFRDTWDEKHYMALCRHIDTGLAQVPRDVMSGALTRIEADKIEQSLAKFSSEDGYCAYSNFVPYLSEKAKEITVIGEGISEMDMHRNKLNENLEKYIASAANAEASVGNSLSLCMSFLDYSATLKMRANNLKPENLDLARAIATDVQDAAACRGNPG